MHRGYFARSLEENKEDPLGGKYGPSVLAAVGASSYPAKLGLMCSHSALYGLLFYQPHQELALATANDGRTDVVLPHARVLLFSPYLLLLRLQGPTLTDFPGRSSWER